MKILHYFLGFPPYRTGGLTRYAYDLMKEQASDGNNIVMALWPGKITLLTNNVKIKRRKNNSNILNYELINPLPVPLDEGILLVDKYMKSVDLTVFIRYLERVEPDVIHIHTLMGLYKEFIEAANQLKIKIVFTTHDYFGLCSKINFYYKDNVCDDIKCSNCYDCNSKALSMKKIYLLQSPIYRHFKNSKIVKMLRKRHRTDFYFKKNVNHRAKNYCDITAQDYIKLRKYYINMLKQVNLIHFNSNVSKKIYEKYFIPKSSCVMAISHKNIKDNRKLICKKDSEMLRITYLGPAKPFKGYNILKNALDKIWVNNKKFKLKIYCRVPDKAPYMEIHQNGFKNEELKEIFEDTDVLVAPSVCYETFGFTVLEAISFGIPVIVSDNVGSKDIIKDAGIIVKHGDVNDLQNAILSLNRAKLNKMKENNIKNVQILSWKRFVNDNYKLYM